MGPEQWALEIADALIAKHEIPADRYDFAYSIQAEVERLANKWESSDET